MTLIIDLLGYFNLSGKKNPPLVKIAKSIGISEDQMQDIANNKITLLNLDTAGRIIDYLQENGYPDFDVADLLKNDKDSKK